ncbi:MAG: hypothetical protein GY725_25015 [bacterium]|nr:hypothetical protein [bacterium]
MTNPRRAHRSFPRATLLFALMLGIFPGGGEAQDSGYRPPTHTTPQEVAVYWVEGRFRTPVTCVREDGTRVELEEAVVFRADSTRGRSAIKATFYGIEDQGFKRCFNLVERNIPDRRGTLFLHFRAHTRLDTGMAEFRRASRDGKLIYHVDGGKLHIGSLGSDGEAESRVIEFGDIDHPVRVETVAPGSDGDKLLSRYNAGEASLPRPRRRFSFNFTGPDDFKLTLHMIEDERRWR